MRIVDLDHIVIRCRDVEAMIHFYCDVLGCTIAKRAEKFGLVHLRAGAALIDLVDVHGELGRAGGAPPAAEGHNMDHFCLRIESLDIDALRQHFGRFGIDLGKVHDNFGSEGNGPSVYLSDPEKNTVELKGPPTALPAR